MKTLRLFLFAGALALTSCAGDTNNDIQVQQAHIDSVARAKAIQQDAINQKKNDSIINAIATAKADSIEKVKGKK